MSERPLTKRQVAAYFQVSERTVDRWRAEGLLPSFKHRNTVRFTHEQVEALIMKRVKKA